jgi:acetyl-CoA C-acetyltransferase
MMNVNNNKVYIIGAARSAIGKFLGSLSSLSATKIGAEIVKALVNRTKIKPEEINEIVVGNAISAGLGQNPAMQIVVYSGLPSKISTYSVNKVCASGLQAIALGAQSIACGEADLIIAGGVESMSNAPYIVKGVREFQKLGNMRLDEFIEKIKQAKRKLNEIELVDEMIHSGLLDCYSCLSMGALAEKIAEKFNISRREQDEFALHSHKKAIEATDKGKFKKEIVPIELPNGKTFKADEGIRRDTNIEKLSSLKPAFKEKGSITPGNASQLSDGASFVVLMSENKIKQYNIKPLAKIEGYISVGSDPTWYGIAPISAVEGVLKKTGYSLKDIDLIEINEAFAVQTIAVTRKLKIDFSKLNVNGGAIALGHPLGATGARILTTLIYALKDRHKNIGLATLCHGGGGATAMIVKIVE